MDYLGVGTGERKGGTGIEVSIGACGMEDEGLGASHHFLPSVASRFRGVAALEGFDHGAEIHRGGPGPDRRISDGLRRSSYPMRRQGLPSRATSKAETSAGSTSTSREPLVSPKRRAA